ncbi:DUF2332 domain-containing protein [Citricoccus sp. GCM10030269]|uniref:DUF2332 domain-containing protein n=1 Tax=Citricoccus sp. GCM10030269 TaxID=3273388 RepID=UPI003610999F
MMDPAIHRGELPPSEVYRRFALEARGTSAVYEHWAESVADDVPVLDLLTELPPSKRQPNLVFAAARLHGAGTSYSSFHETLRGQWAAVRTTILARSTQTNEAARCAVLLPFLAALPQPLALIEVGASAGLCLLLDRYSYRYSDGTVVDPDDGVSEVIIECELGPGITPPSVMPKVTWRAGIDLSPVDVNDAEDRTWLEALVWPEHHDRRARLHAAMDLARHDPPRLVRGDLVQELPALAAEAPVDATLVVFHTAVLPYLDSASRSQFVDVVNRLPGYWISNEGRGVVALNSPVPGPEPDHRFVVAVNGQPRALADPHGRSVTGLPH